MTKKLFFVTMMFAAMCGTVNATNSVAVTRSQKAATSATGLSEFFTEYSLPFTPSRSSSGIEISQYDPIIRPIASSRGFDWRFISAIACAESSFDHTAVSSAGALGLMQVMPFVAQGFDVSPSEAFNPGTNVELGVKHLEQISKIFRFPGSISEQDRLSIVLAAYNCGPGRVLDARRLAVKYGENHNSWSVVSKYLQLMSEPAYFEDEVVRCGVFREDAQTLGFVSKVMRYYDSYRERVML